MPGSAEYARHGDVAVISFNHPPVNSFSHSVRQEIADGMHKALLDETVIAIVLIGSGKLFSGGVDIREFNTPAMLASPGLHDLIVLAETSPKPVIAAIHGNAFGGGLELSLACHYRIAAPGSQLALPEVKIGLLPGGGGTQRLPRLIGVEAALGMIVSGNPMDAAKALKLGLLDTLIEGDLLVGALAFVQVVAQPGAVHPIVAQRAVVAASSEAAIAAARAQAEKTARGFPAPLECIACIEAAVTLPIEEGLAFERERFLALMYGTESQALRHLFFAEREAARVYGLRVDVEKRQIRSVAVIGAGTMGGGIAMNFASVGIPVVLIETSQAALDRGLGIIHKNYAASVTKGRLRQEAMDKTIALITPTLNFELLRDADLVIEAVFEEMDIKQAVFAKIDAIAKPGAILASNTSRLNIDEIAAITQRPQDVIGLHFFSPANVMRLLEIVHGAQTAEDVIVTCMDMAKRIRKIAVLVGVCDGFVGNRMLTPYARQGEFLLEEGASPEQVDRALVDFGMAMGLFTMADMAGLDISWAARKRNAATRPEHLRYSKIADRICASGRFGQKTGAGFYRYTPDSRTPIPDPEIAILIEKTAIEAGIVRGEISDEEIVERCIYALINEGAKILEEGIAQRASDIDIVYVNGYGFPAWRGGPMFYADTLGLERVYARISQFHAKHGEFWTPAPLLESLAKSGGRFNV